MHGFFKKKQFAFNCCLVLLLCGPLIPLFYCGLSKDEAARYLSEVPPLFLRQLSLQFHPAMLWVLKRFPRCFVYDDNGVAINVFVLWMLGLTLLSFPFFCGVTMCTLRCLTYHVRF